MYNTIDLKTKVYSSLKLKNCEYRFFFSHHKLTVEKKTLKAMYRF